MKKKKSSQNTPIDSNASRQKNRQEPLLKKATRGNLEEKVRRQFDELAIRSGQLKQGADREKIAEEQIHIQTKAMEATLDGIFIIDAKKPNFPIIYANSSFQNLTGYLKDEVIGKIISYFTGRMPICAS